MTVVDLVNLLFLVMLLLLIPAYMWVHWTLYKICREDGDSRLRAILGAIQLAAMIQIINLGGYSRSELGARGAREP